MANFLAAQHGSPVTQAAIRSDLVVLDLSHSGNQGRVTLTREPLEMSDDVMALTQKGNRRFAGFPPGFLTQDSKTRWKACYMVLLLL